MHRHIPPPFRSLLKRPVASLLNLLCSGGLIAVTPASVAEEILIRDLENVQFGAVPPSSGTLEVSSDLCVTLSSRGRYSLLGFGNGSSGAFSLVDSGNGVHTLDYSVRITDRGNNRGEPLIAGIPLTNLRGSNTNGNGRCNPTGRIRVIVEGDDIQAAMPGRYSGTLTLTVVPE